MHVRASHCPKNIAIELGKYLLLLFIIKIIFVCSTGLQVGESCLFIPGSDHDPKCAKGLWCDTGFRPFTNNRPIKKAICKKHPGNIPIFQLKLS